MREVQRVQRVMFQAPDVWFGEFNLPADHPEWQREARLPRG